MNSHFDLKAYFLRIGYQGPHTATLGTLRALHKLHTRAIPFENLNPFLGIPVKLDPESLQQKLVHDGRGGYCFEQNLLFRYVLETLGFSVKGLAARVLWNQAENNITQRSHMLLLVTIESDDYIADVGFGAMTLTGPMILEPDKVQETPHEPYRLKWKEDHFILQALTGDTWNTLYRFNLQEQFLVDYEVYNWYLSNHPESHFVTGLIVTRPDNDRRYTLHNNTFKIHHLNKETEKRTLGTATELRNVLENEFKMKLPKVPGLDKALEQLTVPST